MCGSGSTGALPLGHNPKCKAALQHLVSWMFGVFFVYFDEKIIASAYLKALLTFKTFVSSTPSPLSMASVFKNIV